MSFRPEIPWALKSSVEQLKGSVQRAVKEIRSRLLYQIAYIESALDDPEHYDLEGYPQELAKIVDKEAGEITDLLKTADDGRMIQEGIKTVILGKPNAGKSSLLNFLVGEDRAIVTEIEGTTRDILEEYISLNGITLRVIDTARNPRDRRYSRKNRCRKSKTDGRGCRSHFICCGFLQTT